MIPVWQLTGRMGNQMFQYAYLCSQVKNGNIPDVYVQGEEFFEDVKDDMRKIYSTGVVAIDQVSIHVRRGDYVGNSFYVDLFKDGYYERAMDEFPDEEFLVFSDDIGWCKEQPLFKECEFSDGNEVEDFNLMAGCKGHIIANSSFSWWAAYVGGGKTIAPLNWHPDGIERTKVPKEWKRL